MHLEARLKSKLSKNRLHKQLPLRIRLWNNNDINLGPEPTVCVTIKKPRAALCFLNPNLDRLGKAYVEGEIDIDGPLPDVMAIATELSGSESRRRLRSLTDYFTLRHSRRRDARAIRHHYDIANDFYALWLDRNMVYSCAYFKTGKEDIHLAQDQKLDHICRKLLLRPGERFLDIGCGWGGLICWAAKKYGVKALGVTLSLQQYLYVQARIEKEGLADWVEVRLQDYRDIPGENVFDKISSIGMFEHVGLKKLPVYFGVIRRLLKENGLALNHGITTRDHDNRSINPSAGRFIDNYVFPDSELPHVSRTAYEMERQDLEILDMECLRPHYAQTLMHWVARLETQRERAIAVVGEKTYRIWRIYMAGCAHAFERGWVSVFQIVAAKQTLPGLTAHPWTREHQYTDSIISNQEVIRPSWSAAINVWRSSPVKENAIEKKSRAEETDAQ